MARAALHFWEEPCISGKNGSGAVFFSGCNLGCVFCQNEEISHFGKGVQVSEDRLVQIFDRLVEQGATVIVIEHDLDFIANADYVIDMGPQGGEAGGHLRRRGQPGQRDSPADRDRRQQPVACIDASDCFSGGGGTNVPAVLRRQPPHTAFERAGR